MSHKLSLRIAALMALLALFAPPRMAAAASYYAFFNNIHAMTCGNPYSFSFQSDDRYSTPATGYTIRFTISTSAGDSADTGQFVPSYPPSSTGILANDIWGGGASVSQSYTATLTLYFYVNNAVTSTSVAKVSCSATRVLTLISLQNSDGSGGGGGGSAEVPGPGIPAGFALRTIGCDVTVFNRPGGAPVGDNRIINGQTWFVNPTAVKAKDGSLWTEIFVGGFIDGYIPTKCVK